MKINWKALGKWALQTLTQSALGKALEKVSRR
jgi:hypothetical protein